MKERERVLLWLLTVSAVSKGSDINFNDTFLNVLGTLAMEFIVVAMISSFIYFVVSKPLYKFITKQ
jgi:hypothetical protein